MFRDLIKLDFKFISTRSTKQRITFPVSVEQTTNWNSLVDSIIPDRVYSTINELKCRFDKQAGAYTNNDK